MFTLKNTSKFSRHGILETKNGSLQTPFFMPDATRASVRGLDNEDLLDIGIHSLVVNTYHLLLQPGASRIQELGGVHRFMNWTRPVLSDSGGYQVYSLIHRHPELGKIAEEGARFKSPINGSVQLLTPEQSIQIQFDLGIDMMVVLDDPRPNDAPKKDIEEAVERTLRWAKRCKVEYEKQLRKRRISQKDRPLLFAVVQGGKSIALRKRCIEGLKEIGSTSGWDGYGFGARHVDEKGIFMDDVLRETARALPEEKLRFALGVGTPGDIVRCASYGWDMFDCVIPTREGRHSRLFIWKDGKKKEMVERFIDSAQESFYESVTLTNSQFQKDTSPIDKKCDCRGCTGYSRAYIHHLFRAGEPLAARLASIHNLRFYMELMEALRK